VRRIERSEAGGDVHDAVLQPERYRLQLESWIKVISHFGPLQDTILASSVGCRKELRR